MALFGIGGTRARAEDGARAAVAEWSRAEGGYGPETVVKVNEIVCADPACPGFETVILIMPPGRRTLAAKVAKPLAEVTPEDVRIALATLP